MSATFEEICELCDAIKQRAAAGKDIEDLGFKLIRAARALASDPFVPAATKMPPDLGTVGTCPICGDAAVLCESHGGRFWGCKQHPLVPDHFGKPGDPGICETCGKKEMFHYTSQNGKLADTWACLACKSVWEVKGNRRVQTCHPCFVCGGDAHPASSKKTGAFWKCSECETTFADLNGRPVKPEICSHCGGKSLSRFESVDAEGVFFWGCSSCKSIYEDNNGSVGAKLEG